MANRKTFRITKAQEPRLVRLKAALEAKAGTEVSWQFVLSSVLEHGLGALGYPASATGGAGSLSGAISSMFDEGE